jgi:hypothetical protein
LCGKDYQWLNKSWWLSIATVVLSNSEIAETQT